MWWVRSVDSLVVGGVPILSAEVPRPTGLPALSAHLKPLPFPFLLDTKVTLSFIFAIFEAFLAPGPFGIVLSSIETHRFSA